MQVDYRPFEITSVAKDSTSIQEVPSSTAELHQSIDPLADFSPDPKEWLKWFNSLTKEQQLQVNYRPGEFISLTKNSISIQEPPSNTAEIKQSSKKSSTQSLLTPLSTTMPIGGWEHHYSPSAWLPLTDKANCYAYMLNVYTYSGHKLQPGEIAGSTFTSLTTSNIYTAALADMPYLGKSIRSSSYIYDPYVADRDYGFLDYSTWGGYYIINY